MYAFEFRQLTCDILWDEIAFMRQFQFGLHNDVKDLLLTMLNPMTLSQTTTQIVQCDNNLFEWYQKKCWEPHHYKKNHVHHTIYIDGM
jgi:hypothetical protein